MKISGFTLIRNGDRFDYPYLESLRSMLPWVDEVVINVGIGEDATFAKLQKFAEQEGDGKVQLFESDWQLDRPEKKRGGLILSEQTNLALNRCQNSWCLYLQADEVLHEEDGSRILRSIQEADPRSEVEGILFDYVHFYGSFNVVQQSRSAYRREVRVIRKSSGARSIGDAQSFRKEDGTKLKVVHSGARVFHYGWVRTPEAMREKTFFMDQLYHGDPKPDQLARGIPHTGENYRYKKFWGLRPYAGTHPSTMLPRIQSQGWHWDLKNSPWVFKMADLKKALLDTVERWTGHRLFEYRSYRLIK